MKKTVPFSKVLKFDSKILEISSISLEHSFNNMGDEVSGEFIITGDYVVDDESREKKNFEYNLPFDIALGVNYNKDNMVLDIDDFRYEIISSNEVKIDIDLYIDGEILEEVVLSNDREEIEENITNANDIDLNQDVNIDMDNINVNENDNMVLNNMNNIFNDMSNNNDYYTYRVYTVMEGDTVDSIITKYNISLDELKQYNDISNIKPFDKLIIPSNEK